MFGGAPKENRRLAPNRKAPSARSEKRTPPNRRQPPPTAVKRPVIRVPRGPSLSTAKRVARAAVRLAFAAAVVGGVLLLGGMAYHHATESEYFAFTKANITGNKRLTEAEIAEIAGLIDGKNIFKIDLQRATQSLLSHPWIVGAEISRRLPDTINVQIIERDAVALVNLDVLYLVDDMGKVFKRWVRGDPIPAPIVTGISREYYIESPKEVEAILCDAIDLANRYGATGLKKAAPLDEIHLEPEGGFSLTVGEDPIYIRFGRGPYRTKLERLAELIGRLTREGKRAAMIFFDNEVRPDRITVKLKKQPEPVLLPGQIAMENDAKKIMSKI